MESAQESQDEHTASQGHINEKYKRCTHTQKYTNNTQQKIAFDINKTGEKQQQQPPKNTRQGDTLDNSMLTKQEEIAPYAWIFVHAISSAKFE